MIDREDVIRWAWEANIKQAIETPHLLLVNELERFAALVAKAAIQDDLLWQAETETAVLAEREACAQVVWEMKGQCWAYDHDTIAAAIRARGN